MQTPPRKPSLFEAEGIDKDREAEEKGRSMPEVVQLLQPKFKSSISNVFLKEGYYGKFTFLDLEELFQACFGKYLKMYSSFSKETGWTQMDKLKEFTELCKFDIFMRSCQIDYVGSENVSRESYE